MQGSAAGGAGPEAGQAREELDEALDFRADDAFRHAT
jgi:hypothetical protein